MGSYFKFFEGSFRILHYPSFVDEYRHFWASQKRVREENGTFVHQLVTILSIFYALEDATAPGAIDENKMTLLRGYVEVWLESLTGREQLTMSTLRTRALLVIAQQVGAARSEEIWKSTGGLMRSAMAAGLHRDPSEFSHISVFEGEASLAKRIGRNGSDIKDIMRLSVISQLLKAQITHGNREEMMEEGTQSVLLACRRAAAQQDGAENEKVRLLPPVRREKNID
jgi:hypothetical protein